MIIFTEHDSNKPIAVNPRTLLSVRPAGNGSTLILIAPGVGVYVVETFAVVVAKLNGGAQ